MRVVVAVQKWPGMEEGSSMVFPGASGVVAAEWTTVAPHVDVVSKVIPDGGPQSADSLSGCIRLMYDAAEQHVQVAPVNDDSIWLSPAESLRWNPRFLGEALLAIARHWGSEYGTVVIPLGDEPPAGDATDLWVSEVTEMKAALTSLTMVVPVGASRPLLGFHGMSAAVRDGREADAALALAAQEQEQRWSRIAREVDPLAQGSMLMGPSALSEVPGSGAAGGLAYCLAALGARIVPSAPFMVNAFGLAEACEEADLVVSVIDQLTPRTLDHGIAPAMAHLAARRGIPATVLAHSVRVGKRDLMAAGLASAHEAQAGEEGLRDGVRRLAATWTR